MTLVEMDIGLLWAGAASTGAVIGALGHLIAPRQMIWPAAGALLYGALCLLFGTAAVALVPPSAAMAALLLGREWEARHG